MWSKSIPHRFKKMKSANYKKCHRPIRRFFKCFKVQQQIFQNFVKFGKSSWKSKNRDKFYLFFFVFLTDVRNSFRISGPRITELAERPLSTDTGIPFTNYCKRLQYPFGPMSFLIQELRCDFKFFCSIVMSYRLTINW